jgi:CheY-like chemotaxis protein
VIVLVAEDEDSKRERISAVLRDAFPRMTLMEARSVRSAIRKLRDTPPDILILDMSLPTFDIAAGEPGGRPQGFGGIEVVRHMERDDVSVPIIVVTQHPVIPKDGRLIELAGLEAMVRAESPSGFRGLIYYNTLTGLWRGELLALMTQTMDELESRR